MLTQTPGKRLMQYTPNYVVFDLETTGISAAHDEVIEISAVKVENGSVVDEFSTLVDPGCHIPGAASSVNGIYDDMVAGCPCFECALEKFLEFAGDAVLVGHNIHSFDMKFLSRDAQKYWGKTVGNDYIDTLYLARRVLTDLKHHRLVDLSAHYGISVEGAHRALNDCRMNQQVFERLAKEPRRPDAEKALVCPKCGSELRRRSGKYGEFWGCTGYPVCRFTRNA